MCPVSVLIADDHEIVRRGLRALIHEQPGWQVVAEAIDGREAVAKAEEFKPHVAILDITMPSWTAETHRSNLMRRLNCHSVTELVRYAIRKEIVEA